MGCNSVLEYVPKSEIEEKLLPGTRKYFDNFQLPLLWWQTPMGVPSATPGGRPGAFRDNKMDYFLNHASEMVNAGGFGVVFSQGHTSQTTLDTDRGQYKRLSGIYFNSPVKLP